MAIITVFPYRKPRPIMPDLCMRCGAPTRLREVRTFIWSSPWWYLLLCTGIGIVIVIIIRIIATRKMTAEIPICSNHQYHWQGINRTILIFLIVILVSVAFNIWIMTRQLANENLVLALSVGVWGCCLTGILILSMSKIRPHFIDHEKIILCGVSQVYADHYRIAQSAINQIGSGNEATREGVPSPPTNRQQSKWEHDKPVN